MKKIRSRWKFPLAFGLLYFCIVFTIEQRLTAQQSTIAELQRLFQNPPDDSRIMMRWWWFGPAVTKPQLEREMRLMKEGGIGGFEIQPVYPLALDDANIKTLPFLSDDFIDAVRFTNSKARELGLRVDLTLGSGWPFGGPAVPVSQAASRLRVDRVKVASRRVPIPQISEGEKLLAVFIAPAQGAGSSRERVREISDLRDGAVRLPENLEGPHELIFFIASRTGQQVKRAAIGGEGFVVDHYDRAAIDNYLKVVGDRLMQGFDKPPYAIFCDSLEVFNSDWSPDFLAEFQKRRGYDLKPYLPALLIDIGPETAAIRHDWGQTLTEIFNERFLVPMRDWSRKNNTRFRIQGYGIPPMTLSGNAYADLSEGEGTQWKVVRAARWASSANHLYGRPVTSSETWTWLHSPTFRATPLDVKAEADLHFLQGVNQLIGHGWPYTPENVEYPGWRFYAAAVFNEKNPWWIVMPDLSRYLQRVSFMMRQGAPVNDVALYLPNHDAWAGYTSGRVHYLIEALRDSVGPDVMPAILESGFNLDFFDDEALQKIGRVEKGRLVLGTNWYKAVVLPNVERIPLETLKRLEEFSASGGTLIASRRIPNTAPGLQTAETEKEQIRALSRRLFEGEQAKAHFVKDERAELGRKLSTLVEPDVTFSPAVAEIGFIHRHTDTAEIYFIANTSNARQRVQAKIRSGTQHAEAWNPFDGTITPVETQVEGPRSIVPIELEPYESRILVFTNRNLDHAVERKSASIPPPVELTAGWRVSYGQSGRTVNMDRLHSWTDEEETRFYSGTATFERELIVPGEMLQSGNAIWLDFGTGTPLTPQPRRNGMRAWLDAPIRDAAVVYVNDQRAGALWCPPYSIDITKLVRRGSNRLRIVVGNTAINYLAGRKLPDYKLLNLRHGERFQPQDMENLQPLPSGILGTLRLVSK